MINIYIIIAALIMFVLAVASTNKNLFNSVFDSLAIIFTGVFWPLIIVGLVFHYLIILKSK